jgi:DNA-binding response OmpR family regulator
MEPDDENPPTRRLLIVDDDRLVLKIIHDFFVPNGYEVDEASDGAEALARLDEAVPDIIVADVLMPNLDGWELFEQVRARPATARVPFVFLTTERDLPQRLRGFHLGADDYITKPFDVEELHARVERILQRQEETEAAVFGAGTLLTGAVRHMPLSDLLQILSLNGKDGTVVLKQAAERGLIVFAAGSIVHAACGKVAGVKALYRMLGWVGATFRVLPPGDEEAPRTVDAPTTSVLMDGLVSLDEWNRWHAMLPETGAVLELAPDATERIGPRRLAPAEADVIGRAKVGAAVGEIIEASPLPDADLAEAMCTLISSGVLYARI